jgi:hypothetical protein
VRDHSELTPVGSGAEFGSVIEKEIDVRGIGRLVMIGICLVLASCSGGGATDEGGGTAGMTADQVCALLTTDEISAATGLAVGAGVPEGVNVPSCTWTGDGGAVSVSWITPDLVGQIAPALQGNSVVKLVPLSGVGDAAFYTEEGTIGASLDFSKGSNGLDVSFGMGASATLAQVEAAEKTLALDALARM